MPTPISNLKVGDRVRAKSNLGRWIEGPITEIDGHEEQAVRVREDGGSSLWCLNETVELMNEPATGEPTTMAKALESAERIEDPRVDAANDAPKFKTGDRVHHKDLALNGTICGPCTGFDGCFMMKPDGESYEMHADQDDLELVDEEVQPEPEATPYRQGETILSMKVVNDPDRMYIECDVQAANHGDLARATMLLRCVLADLESRV